MFELFVVLMVLGGLWLFGSLIGLAFKLLFGLIGGVFALLGGLFGLIIGAVVMIAMVPVLLLTMLPLLLPVAMLAGFIWLIVHLARKQTAPAPPAQA
ncbi:MAG: hypothetical protein WBW92_06910 [Rhodanobacteraceae bacterium]